jgi:hypothetical protein
VTGMQQQVQTRKESMHTVPRQCMKHSGTQLCYSDIYRREITIDTGERPSLHELEGLSFDS